MLRTGELIAVREVRLIAKKALVVLVIAIGFPGSLMLMASPHQFLFAGLALGGRLIIGSSEHNAATD
jgi:hypothetical protein